MADMFARAEAHQVRKLADDDLRYLALRDRCGVVAITYVLSQTETPGASQGFNRRVRRIRDRCA